MKDMVGRTVQSYKIVEFVGKGGHGAVYRAHHMDTGAKYAIKVILPEHEANETLAVRFQQEIQIIRELQHPHIINLIEDWQDEDGLWVVMEWAGGGDLRRYLEKHGHMQPKVLVRILLQVASALSVAHARNIIHRDLKPDNILLDDNGDAQLTDFGIAKRHGFKAITSAGAIVGSPNYLSPEQIVGGAITARTDVFALGILIFELLSGSHPFEGAKTQVELMLALVQKDLPPLTSVSDELLVDLNKLIQRATAKNSDDRYQSVSDLARHYAAIVGFE